MVLAALCLFFKVGFVEAQFYEPSQKSLYVGDSIPQSLYQATHEAVDVRSKKTQKIKLTDYKDKLIILDFWATWCKPCLASLTELDSIKNTINSDDLIVVPVTYQTAKQSKASFDRFKWNMISVVGDTTLAQIFPTAGIPHQVWLKNGKIIAIPEPSSLTAQLIEKVIDGEPYSGKMKLVRKKYQALKPMFNNGNIGNGEHLLFQSSFTGYQDKLLQHKLESHFTKDTSSIYAHNIEFTSLYYEAFKDEIFKEFSKQTNSGVILEISTSLRQRMDKSFNKLNDKNKKDSIFNVWKQNNWYCYNLFCAYPVSEKQAKKQMQTDLNHFFGLCLGIEGQIENRKKTFAVLTLLADKEKVIQNLKTTHKTWLRLQDDPDTYTFQNDYFDALSSLALTTVTPYQILDETGIDKLLKVDFTLSTKIRNNLPAAQKELSKYGLDLKIEERTVPILVIREQQHASFIETK